MHKTATAAAFRSFFFIIRINQEILAMAQQTMSNIQPADSFEVYLKTRPDYVSLKDELAGLEAKEEKLRGMYK